MLTVWPPNTTVSTIPATRVRRVPDGPRSVIASPTPSPVSSAHPLPSVTQPRSMRANTCARGAPSMSVWSTCSYCAGANPSKRPSEPFFFGDPGRSVVNRKRSRATTFASGMRARRFRRPSAIVCCSPCPGANPCG